MPGLGDLERLFLRMLTAMPPVLVGLAVIFSLAVLLGFLPAIPFLALAILLVSIGMLMLAARQAKLEELLRQGLGRPRRLLEGLDKRLRTLERRVEELISRPPETAEAERQAAVASQRSSSSSSAAPGAVRASRSEDNKKQDSHVETAQQSLSADTTSVPAYKQAEPPLETSLHASNPAFVPRRDVPRSLPGGPLATPARQLLEGFRLYMEPVIDRFAGRTALYRAVPGLVLPQTAKAQEDRLCLGTDAHLQAARHGVARALDLQLLQAARAFAAQMRQRQTLLPVIVPLSYDFLMAPEALKELEQLLSENAVEDLLAVEIPQQAMAALGERVVRLIAWLAERGLRMSLGQADPCHMDARALSALGFVWCDVPYHVLRQALSQGCTIPVLPQTVVAGLHGQADLETLPPACRLVRGRAFAPPRRVKDEIFRSAGLSRAAA